MMMMWIVRSHKMGCKRGCKRGHEMRHKMICKRGHKRGNKREMGMPGAGVPLA